jgi:hypothetical protein
MPDILRTLRKQLLDEGGIEQIFSHLRNLLIATVIIAAGSYAIAQPAEVEIFGVLDLEVAGFGVAAIGFILVGLNLLDGLCKLARLETPLIPRIALGCVYLFISMRLMQLIVLLRAG